MNARNNYGFSIVDYGSEWARRDEPVRWWVEACVDLARSSSVGTEDSWRDQSSPAEGCTSPPAQPYHSTSCVWCGGGSWGMCCSKLGVSKRVNRTYLQRTMISDVSIGCAVYKGPLAFRGPPPTAWAVIFMHSGLWSTAWTKLTVKTVLSATH